MKSTATNASIYNAICCYYAICHAMPCHAILCLCTHIVQPSRNSPPSYNTPKLENKSTSQPATATKKKTERKEKKEKKNTPTNYFEGKTSQLTIPTSSTGRSAFPVFTLPILSTTSIPLITCPKTVCAPSKCLVGASVMKN